MSQRIWKGAALALVVACGGGDGHGRTAEPEGFSAQLAAGPGGAVTVEGMELDFAGARLQLLDDGLRTTLLDAADLARRLQPGMVVSLFGEAQGSAATITEVVHRGAVRGTLALQVGASLNVAGFQALLGPDTPVVDVTGAPVDPQSLAAGTPVEVNG